MTTSLACSTSFSLYSTHNFECSIINTISIKKPINNIVFNCVFQTPSLINAPKQPYIAKTPLKTSPLLQSLQKAVGMMLDMVESAIVTEEYKHPLPKTSDPNVQLSGNFAPVPEMPVQNNLPVIGTIPDCIRGVYVRNGANPFHQPISGHHLFDGDGMVHAVKFNGRNSVSYACRFTETQRLIQERESCRPLFPKSIGEVHGHSGIAKLVVFYTRCLFGLVDITKGMGVANAGLIYFQNKLLAMSEDDLPYELRIKPSGDLETIGRYDFDKQLNNTMIAHPKVDPNSKELFGLSYNVLQMPYLKYFKISSNGCKSKDVVIPLKEPTMIHDFAITENYVVIPDQGVVFKVQEMLRGGSPVIYDKRKKSRFGILLKNAKHANDMIWIESPDTFCFHLWNAWEEIESDEIVVIGSCMTPPDSIFNECDENLMSVLSEIRLNLKTGKSRKQAIIRSPDQKMMNLDAGMVNRNKLGRKTKYAYLAIAEPWPKVSGLAKVDLLSGDVEKFMYGDGRYGGEPFFLPRDESNSLTEEEEEDDGYIIAFVHDEKTWKSELQIVDAKSLKLEATIMLPSRVPYGFHGTFITSKELECQMSFYTSDL